MLDALDAGYKRLLLASLHVRTLVVTVAILFVAITGWLFLTTASELSPVEDRGIIRANAIAPEGSTIQYSDYYAKKMESIMQSVPESKWNFTAVGFPVVTDTFSVLGLTDWSDRSRSSSQIADELRKRMFAEIPGTFNRASNPPSLGQSGGSQPIEVIIQSSASYEEMDAIVGKIMAKLAENKGIVTPDADLKLNKPELRVVINRDKVAALGVDISTIGRTLETLLGSRQVTRFKRGSEQYDVMVQIEDDERTKPNDISRIFIRTPTNDMVQLSNLVTLEEGVAPRELNHFNKLRAVTIKSSLAPGYSTGEALAYIERTIRDTAPDMQIDYDGQSREYKQSSASLLVTFMLALLFIYLVLAAQFESFIDPLIILLAVPLAMAGALLAMKGVNLLDSASGTLNVYSQIGLIALVGLISKHGIMMVEFANQLQERGHSLRDAIAEAAIIRLRPILMTTSATILGALPLALAHGAGSESRQAIGWVIVGGMSIGTVMTLFVVPTFYLLLSRVRHPVQIDENKLLNSPSTAS